jgi:imidazole glycerol-phosphate synthase subunit HisH
MIAIIDYGAGNLTSVRKAFAHLGADVIVTADAADLARAEKLVLPGVGHFAATEALDRAGLRDAILAEIARGKPFLGICVGLQWLFEGSEEAPGVRGAGVLRGLCRAFPASVKSPHVGWNTLAPRNGSRLLRDIGTSEFVYYTHSYAAPVCDAAAALTDYGAPFAAAVERDSVFGVQFHPEKSGAAGLRILQNFCEL